MAIQGAFNLSNDDERQRLHRAIDAMKGEVCVDIKRFVRGRTNRQLAYYFPCFCKPLADFMYEQGEGWTLEQSHELLKAKFLRETIIHPGTGEILGERVKSTGELSTLEFNHYLDQCKVYLFDMFGITVPDPLIYHESDYTSPPPKAERKLQEAA